MKNVLGVKQSVVQPEVIKLGKLKYIHMKEDYKVLNHIL